MSFLTQAALWRIRIQWRDSPSDTFCTQLKAQGVAVYRRVFFFLQGSKLISFMPRPHSEKSWGLGMRLKLMITDLHKYKVFSSIRDCFMLLFHIISFCLLAKHLLRKSQSFLSKKKDTQKPTKLPHSRSGIFAINIRTQSDKN